MGWFLPLLAKTLLPIAADKLINGNQKSNAEGVDYQKLRDDASAAGFNPLTALLAGGGQGYQREFNPALSSGSFLSEAISRGVDTVFNRSADDTEAKSIRLANELAAKNLAQKAASMPRPFGYTLTAQRPFDAVGASDGTSRPPVSSVAPVAVMVPTVGTDGIVRMGPNPDGPDLDTAAYALVSDAYYRATNMTRGRPLGLRDQIYPPRVGEKPAWLPPLALRQRNPWLRGPVAKAPSRADVFRK